MRHDTATSANARRPEPAQGWPAAIHLAFRHDGTTTRLHRGGGYGPLYVQKPFYPEPDVCHTYLLHPPGGVVGGDELLSQVQVEPGAHGLLTTPAATKYLRSRGPCSQVRQHLQVADGASLEYLPQETIVFNAARATTATRIELTGSARVVAWEVVALGRPAIDEPLQQGEFSQQFQIHRWCSQRQCQVPLVIDQQRWVGSGTELQAAWGLQTQPVLGTLFACPVDWEMLTMLRKRLAGDLAMTLINGVLVARALGPDTESVSEQLRKLWQALRPLLLQRPAVAPNIWHT
ncbi:MAG: urease accessory protein UreD [Pseudomonadales bacterium]